MFSRQYFSPAKHAKYCTGAYKTECDYRMFVANNEHIGDSIMKATANTNGPIFM